MLNGVSYHSPLSFGDRTKAVKAAAEVAINKILGTKVGETKIIDRVTQQEVPVFITKAEKQSPRYASQANDYNPDVYRVYTRDEREIGYMEVEKIGDSLHLGIMDATAGNKEFKLIGTRLVQLASEISHLMRTKGKIIGDAAHLPGKTDLPHPYKIFYSKPSIGFKKVDPEEIYRPGDEIPIYLPEASINMWNKKIAENPILNETTERLAREQGKVPAAEVLIH